MWSMASAGGGGAVTDGDKIRAQLALDVEELNRVVRLELGVQGVTICSSPAAAQQQ